MIAFKIVITFIILGFAALCTFGVFADRRAHPGLLWSALMFDFVAATLVVAVWMAL